MGDHKCRGRSDRKWQFSKKKSGFAVEQKFFDKCIFFRNSQFYAGGDATKNHDFQRGKQRLQGPKIVQGCEMFKLNFDDVLMKDRGDATENVNFQRRKQRLQGRKNFQLNFDEFKHLTI